jgi:tetratricopeptide (TPR) repeat protein
MLEHYTELEVKFSRLQPGRYRAVVRSSAAHEISNTFDWPALNAANQDQNLSPGIQSPDIQIPDRQGLSEQRTQPRSTEPTRHLGAPEGDRIARQSLLNQAEIIALGVTLFNAIFGNGERFANFMQRVLDDLPNQDGVRIRLRLNLEQTPELAIIPWEYIRNTNTNSFLVQEMSLVRDLSPARIIQGVKRILLEQLLPGVKSLRVLVMISEADDLETQEELDHLKKACENHAVSFDHIEPDLKALRNALSEHEYQIFHYIGHGTIGEIVLQDNDDHGGTQTSDHVHEITGARLGVDLRGLEGMPHLVVLNTCQGAALEHGDLYSSVAAELIQQGVPAVIAMQFKIKDRSAIQFAAGLYRAIAEGATIDEALIQARKELYPTDETDSNLTQDWGIPVMYARGKTSRVPREILRRFQGPLVGRDRQLEQMKTVLNSKTDRSRATVISGASGAGKTRMSIELANALHPNDSTLTIYGEADANDSRPLAWLETMVRHLLESQPDLRNRLSMAEQAVIDRLLRDHAPVQESMLEPGSESRLRQNAIRKLISHFEHPTLLIVDGLRWLDTTSLESLSELWRDPPERGLALVATLEAAYDPSPEVSAFIGRIIQDQSHNVYPLSPLSETEIEQLAVAYKRPISDVRAIARSSGGIAQYVIELLSAPDGKISADLNEVLMGRLRHAWSLDANAKTLLEAVAVLCPHASPQNLCRVTNLESTAFNDVLRKLMTHDVLSEGDGIRFVSRLMRDKTLDQLSQNQHDELHRHCAEHLADQPSRAALHYRAARSHGHTWNDQDPQSEIDAYLEAASEYALRSGKLERSLDWLDCATEITNISTDQRVQIQTDRARILERHGKHDIALHSLGEIEFAIDLVQNPEIKAGYLAVYADILSLKTEQLDKARALAARVEETLAGNNTPAAKLITSDALNALGTVARRQENLLEAKPYFQQSLAFRSFLNDQKRRIASLNNLGIVCDMLGERKEAERHFQESIKQRRLIGDDIGLTRTLNNFGIFYYNQQKYQEAQQVLQEALEQSRIIGDAWLIATCLLSLGMNALLQHQLQTAREYANAALLEAKDHAEVTEKAQYNLAELNYLLGDTQATRQALQALTAFVPPTSTLETSLRADHLLLATEFLYPQEPDQAKRIAEGVVAHTNADSSGHCRASALLAVFDHDAARLPSSNKPELKPILEWAMGMINNTPGTLQAGLERASEPLDIHRFLQGLILLEPENAATWEAKIAALRNTSNASQPIMA